MNLRKLSLFVVATCFAGTAFAQSVDFVEPKNGATVTAIGCPVETTSRGRAVGVDTHRAGQNVEVSAAGKRAGEDQIHKGARVLRVVGVNRAGSIGWNRESAA